MRLLVQKYGGTSLATTERITKVARRIARSKDEGNQVLVVVSAMGGTTDELVALASRISAAPPARELDMLLTAGERVSMALLSMALHELGHAAVSYTGSQSGIITDTHHADARILEVRAARLEEALAQGRIVIVAGFQGVSAEREVTTLGRGGSDTTAVALAAALSAERCEICSDVDGVCSADPRRVPGATKLHEITYDEMLELATHGAQVLHPRCVEIARRFGVALEVRSSFTNTRGTVIRAMERIETTLIRGITCDEDVATITLRDLAPRASGALLAALGDDDIATHLVVQTPHESTCDVVCLLRRGDVARASDVLESLVQGSGRVELDEDVAALSIVGQGIQSHPGTVARVLGALRDAGVHVRLVSSSAISLTCIVPRSDADHALQTLHTQLGLDAPESE
jgi:aspartate kinase